MKKLYYLTIGLAFCAFIYLSAKDIHEVTPIDASQRNQITVSGGGGGSGDLGATTITNLTSSNITITGHGSNVLNIEAGAGTGDAVLAANQTWTGVNNFTGVTTNTAQMVFPTVWSLDPSGNRFFYHQNGQLWANMNQDSGDTGLYYTNGTLAIHFQFNNGSPYLDLNGASRRIRIGAENSWKDTAGATILDIDNKALKYGNGAAENSVAWYSGGGRLENTWTNRGDLIILTNLTVNGRVNFPIAAAITSAATITPNRNSAGSFYVELTNNPTLNVPTNIRSGENVEIYLRANNITNTVTLASNIIIPTSSTLVSPFTIQTNTTTILTIGFIGTNYVVKGYVPGYNLGPLQ
jgi:hypothetical protein